MLCPAPESCIVQKIMNKACYRLRKDIQCLVWLYDTSSKLASGNLSKYLKFMPSLVTSVKEIHAAIPIIPIISTWWKMGSKGTLIRETSGKNTWIGGHWKMWPPVSCLFVLHSPLSHSSHRVTSKIITVSSFSTLCIHVSLTKGVFRKEFHISEKYPSHIRAHSQMSMKFLQSCDERCSPWWWQGQRCSSQEAGARGCGGASSPTSRPPPGRCRWNKETILVSFQSFVNILIVEHIGKHLRRPSFGSPPPFNQLSQ